MTLLGWSSVPLFLHYFSHHVDLWTSNGWRYGFSAVFWLPVLVYAGMKRTLPRGLMAAAVIPAAINSLAQILFVYAHYLVEPALVTFGLRSNIVFSVLGAAIFFAAERRVIRRPLFLVGLGILAGGVLCMVLSADEPLNFEKWTGLVVAVVSGAGFAFYAVSVRGLMKPFGSIQSFAAISLYTAVVMVGLMIAFGKDFGLSALDLIGDRIAEGWWIDRFSMLLLSALIGIALGHVFYYHSIKILGLATSAAVVQLQPFIVSAGGLWLFGQDMNALQWTFGVVAVGGALLILWEQTRATAAARRESASTTSSATPDLAVAASVEPVVSTARDG